MDETRTAPAQRPFPGAPDKSTYYPATTHEQALAQLLQALADGEGLALLTGEPGTGKTLVCHCLLERLAGTGLAGDGAVGDAHPTAFLTNSHFADRRALFQAILFDLSQPHTEGTEQELRLRLTDFLLGSFAAGKRTVLVIDEAQYLTVDLLEELRLLGNLEAGGAKALQVVLVGQPMLLETLRLPELTALRQRLRVRCQLETLGVEEAADYLRHHLRRPAARSLPSFSDEGLAILAQHTSGLPRLLNQAAHQALQLARAGDSDLVDAEVVLEALLQVGIEVDESESSGETSEEAKLAAEEPSAATLAYEVLKPSA